jgi:L-threonylcarbamoyladenylate synthase
MISDQVLDKAITLLRQGGLVAFPTETVYGLGADAKNPTAIQRIFAAKGRPADHPVIVHLADSSQLSEWACDISESALRLAAAFWPGPLTLILKKAPEVSPLLTGGQDTIGLRVPSHPIALALLKGFGSGLAAPSANRFGHISPTTASAVQEELNDSVDYVLDGGQCEVGVESTIVNLSGPRPVILRPGMISAKQIEAVLQQSVAMSEKNAPRVSGALESHYAPSTKTLLIRSDALSPFLATVTAPDLPIAIVSCRQPPVLPRDVEWVVMSQRPEDYAHDLYATLRMLDKRGFQQLLVEEVPQDEQWDAIRDRLQRASLDFFA